MSLPRLPHLPLGLILLLGLALAPAIPGPARAQEATSPEDTGAFNTPGASAIAMHGTPAYPDTIQSFPYTDQNSMVGGTLVVGELGTFDTLNPFIVKGTQATSDLDHFEDYAVRLHTFESLMKRGVDEPFTLYGLLAERVVLPPDRRWIEFHLRPEAHFSDGSPVTVEDVAFSRDTLAEKGRPNMRRYYKTVARTEITGPHSIRFDFNDEGNRETPLILALMPILSKNYYQTKTFSETTLEPPLGSGPYTITQVDPGRSLTFTRDPNYWGKDLAINRYQNNFNVIQYKYYRDPAVLFEAFKRGEVLYRLEKDAKTWAEGYDFPAARQGLVVREQIPHGRAAYMYGFVFNTRRPLFHDVRVRRALTLLFNFEWMNQNFFHSSYQRLQSYFDNSELSSHGRPASETERHWLARYKDEIAPGIMEHGWNAPVGGGPEQMRANKRAALDLLAKAGWRIENGALVNGETGAPFKFEILLTDRTEERIALAFARDLQSVGIAVSVRLADAAQYYERTSTYDFDMTTFKWWPGTLSPGNEQAFRFGSREADIDGTFNLAGVRSAGVDDMIGKLTNARTREDLVYAARALDRLLMSGDYVIPFYFQPYDRVAYWIELKHPDRIPLMGNQVLTWWMTPDN